MHTHKVLHRFKVTFCVPTCNAQLKTLQNKISFFFFSGRFKACQKSPLFSLRFLVLNDVYNPIQNNFREIRLTDLELASWDFSFELCDITVHKWFFNDRNYNSENIKSLILFRSKIWFALISALFNVLVLKVSCRFFSLFIW